LSPNPILKVLSTFQRCEVQSLLMGGQACILYGAAEFSRDTDFVLLHSEENLEKVRKALSELDAEPVFLPPLEARFLARGHACHFRSRHPEALGFRIDVMSVLRGCEGFDRLWSRRVAVDLPDLPGVTVISLPDLVLARKTQGDKDWPLIRRLVEVDYELHRSRPTEDRSGFWIRESRTPSHLLALADSVPSLVAMETGRRPLLGLLPSRDSTAIEKALLEEQEAERARDRDYWKPLREELAALRRDRGP
jgi:hypothetical protein